MNSYTKPPFLSVGDSTEESANNLNLLREKSAHITKAARAATIANFIAPSLCIPMFMNEVPLFDLILWISYMSVAVIVRTWMIFRLEQNAANITNPELNLKILSYALGIVGVGWGLGWAFIEPQLGLLNQMIYIYGTTAAMISSMFAYSLHKPAFYAFNLPFMFPSVFSVFLGARAFSLPIALGLISLYIVVLSIARNFSQIFEDSIRLRFRNERLYNALASERDQSVSANVAKSRFIAVASHDLRQPMHAVNVYLELIDAHQLPLTESKLLLKIKNSIFTLNAMFDSLLNISKLDADVTQVKRRVFFLEELTATLRDLNETKAKDKRLGFNIDALNFLVHGDIVMLQQIITNLISNAIQYTDSGTINIAFKLENDFLVIEVRDTGRGIAKSDQQLIFNEFYRADSTRSLHDGLGLGLSIVKRLCDLINAEIQIASEIGEGTCFTVKTTFTASSNIEDLQPFHISPKSIHQDRKLHGKSIAIIEDNPIIVDAYSQVLTSKGAQVQVLSEYDDELEIQISSIDHIDCILSDYRLSETTGDVLIQKLRADYNEEIPAIIVTADTTPSHMSLFAKLNVRVLHKPISFEEVSLAIEEVITNNPI